MSPWLISNNKVTASHSDSKPLAPHLLLVQSLQRFDAFLCEEVYNPQQLKVDCSHGFICYFFLFIFFANHKTRLVTPIIFFRRISYSKIMQNLNKFYKSIFNLNCKNFKFHLLFYVTYKFVTKLYDEVL
jgi:hypothetical protein